jgi:hypothetical protein
MSTDSPNEYAALFTAPAALQVGGAAWAADRPQSANVRVRLYDSANTVLAEQTMPKSGNATGEENAMVIFPAPVTLTAGQQYRLAWAPDAADDTEIITLDWLDALGQSGLWNWDAPSFQLSSRTGTGAWTNTALRQPVCGLLLDGIILAATPVISGLTVDYNGWTRTGPLNTPWGLRFTVSALANGTWQVRTAAAGGGTLVASGSYTTSSPVSTTIAYNASGLADGSNTLYVRGNDGTNWGDDVAFNLKRDDVAPTAVTGVTIT